MDSNYDKYMALRIIAAHEVSLGNVQHNVIDRCREVWYALKDMEDVLLRRYGLDRTRDKYDQVIVAFTSTMSHLENVAAATIPEERMWQSHPREGYHDFSLRDAVRKACSFFSGYGGITFQYPSDAREVRSIETYLVYAVAELLHNSVDAIQAKGGSGTINIYWGVNADQRDIVIGIVDSAQTIDERVKANLKAKGELKFPLFTTKNQTDNPYEGLFINGGSGLYLITHWALAEICGRIRYKSRGRSALGETVQISRKGMELSIPIISLTSKKKRAR